MKTWLGLLLTVSTFMVGCASGDYASRPAYPAVTTTYRDTGMFQNPETSTERENRIWSEESGR
jgi:hypothetical protein